MMIPDVIKVVPIKGGRFSDGEHVYWRDGDRIRWALIRWPDDGIGSRTHGAAADLLLAIEDAWGEKIKREDASHERR